MVDIPPPPRPSEPWYPFIIGQVPDGDGGILVTWSLPGLRRATVRVPADVWIEGHHVTMGEALAMTVTPPHILDDVVEQDESDIDGDDATY